MKDQIFNYFVEKFLIFSIITNRLKELQIYSKVINKIMKKNNEDISFLLDFNNDSKTDSKIKSNNFQNKGSNEPSAFDSINKSLVKNENSQKYVYFILFYSLLVVNK